VRYIEIDEALDRLEDFICGIVAYFCPNCKQEFFCYDDTAKFCPFCRSEVKVEYERYVDLLDWGWKKV